MVSAVEQPAVRTSKGAARLFLIDVPPASASAFKRLRGFRAIEAALDWSPSDIGDPAPAPGDVILLWVHDAVGVTMSRVTAIHANYPRVPFIALVPRRARRFEPLLLSAGVHEIVHDAAELRQAATHARGRVELLANATRRDSREHRHDYEGLFPNLYDWIYVVGVAEDGALSFETVNPPLHAPGNFLNPDFVGRSPEACLRAETAKLLRTHVERVIDEGCPLQFDEELQDHGATRSFQTILTPIRNKWGRIHRIAGISRDVTSLREAQAALQASEERLALALEGTQQALWDWDVEKGVLYRSPRWFEMLGLSPNEVTETFEAGLSRVHPDDHDGVWQALRLHLDGHMPRIQAEYRVLSGSGEWIWLFDVGKVVSWSSAGHPARIIGLCTEISERRRAEESLRALVGGVVHEMRNPAFGIGMNLDALEATFGEDARFTPFVTALRESCNRILTLMNDLRDYGEPRTMRAEPCRVRTLVDQAAESCQALAAERKCRIEIRFENDSLILPLHAFRIHQVFRNLIENALYHSPEGAAVTVSCVVREIANQAWALFAVEDEGPGFDADALKRAFEPFFTRRKGGTGLGLSIVRRVVEEHGGVVVAANQPGGAIVRLRLPIPRVSMEALEKER